MKLNPKKHKMFITIVILILVIGLVAAYVPLIFLRPRPSVQTNGLGPLTPPYSIENPSQSYEANPPPADGVNNADNFQPLDLEGFSQDLEKEDKLLDEINDILNP